jgi:PAS domain S-box-containing protein
MELENAARVQAVSPQVGPPGHVETQLRQSEERFRLMVAAVQDYAIFMLDPQGYISTWNIGAERIKGYSADEIIGQHFSRFYPQEAIDRQWPKVQLQRAEQLGHVEDEGWRVRKDGSRFWADVVITALRDEKGHLYGFAKVTRDLTERRASEEAIRRANIELERRIADRTAELLAANKSLHSEIEERGRLEAELHDRVAELATEAQHKNDFLAMLAHELRNPLAPIRNALHLLKLPGADPATTRQARGMMERQLQHLVRLVDDLLDVSRLMRDRIELRLESVELASIIARAIETAQPAIDAHGHELVVSLPNEPVTLEGDVVRLAQVFSNLLNNAAKFTPTVGRIWLSAETNDGQVNVRVRDSGAGIAPELLPRIFDLFVQADRSLARSQGGLGVGLTVVKRLVEMHGGSVVARSAGAGQGSEFSVRLPVVAKARMPAARPSRFTNLATLAHRVLVVDDNVDAAESAAMLLRLWGHAVQTAHDGPFALQAARAFRPEIVLLDIGLPGLNGYEVAKQLRAQPWGRGMYLVAMTGFGQDDDKRRSLAAGFDVHLTKPLDPVKLEQLIASQGEGVHSSAPT